MAMLMMRKGKPITGKTRSVLPAAVVAGAGIFLFLPLPRVWAQGPFVPPPSPAPPVFHPLHPRGGKGEAAGGRLKNRPVAPPAKAADPVRLMERMVKAGMNRPFLAREITLTANGKETEQWVKWEPHKGVRVENLRPNPGDLLIDNFKGQFVYSAQNKQWAQRDSLLPHPQGRVSEVLQRITSGDLRAEWVGQDKVAGRSTDIVQVGPPAGVAAPSRRFWIDRASGLRLKMEEVGPSGRTLASSYYVFVDVSPRFNSDDFAAPPANMLSPKDGDGRPKGDHKRDGEHRDQRRTFHSFDEAAQAGIVPVRPAYLPTGFVLRVIDAVNVKPGQKGRITQRYANGLTVLSLIQTGQKLPIPPRFAEQLGPNQTGFLTLRGTERAYVWRDAASGLSFLLIGNLPDDQLKRIADSVK